MLQYRYGRYITSLWLQFNCNVCSLLTCFLMLFASVLLFRRYRILRHLLAYVYLNTTAKHVKVFHTLLLVANGLALILHFVLFVSMCLCLVRQRGSHQFCLFCELEAHIAM